MGPFSGDYDICTQYKQVPSTQNCKWDKSLPIAYLYVWGIPFHSHHILGKDRKGCGAIANLAKCEAFSRTKRAI